MLMSSWLSDVIDWFPDVFLRGILTNDVISSLGYFRSVFGPSHWQSPTTGHYFIPAPAQGDPGVEWVSYPTQLDNGEMGYEPLDSHFKSPTIKITMSLTYLAGIERRTPSLQAMMSTFNPQKSQHKPFVEHNGLCMYGVFMFQSKLWVNKVVKIRLSLCLCLTTIPLHDLNDKVALISPSAS